MKLRRSALAVLGALALAMLAGCSSGGSAGSGSAGSAASSSSSGVVHLEYWTWWPTASSIVDVWNKSHPNIQVTAENAGQGSSIQYSKLAAAVQAGQGPDLALAEYEWMPAYVTGGIAADISQYTGPIKSAYSQSVWNLVAFGDGVYGVPLDQGPMAYMYRSDLLAKYGLTPPKTWQEFAADAKIVHTKDPSVYLANFNPTDAEFFAGLARQAGAQWYQNDDGTWQVGINDAASKSVADFWNNLIKQGLVLAQPTGTPQYNKLVSEGKVLSVPGGSWNMTSHNFSAIAANTIGKWQVAPLPQWTAGDASVSFAGGSATIVTKTSKHPKEAMEFLSWLGASTGGDTAIVQRGGNLPASNVGLQVFKALPATSKQAVYGQSTYGSVMLAAASNTRLVTWGPNTNVAFTAYTDAIGKAITNHTSLSEALDSVQQATVSDLKNRNYKVKD